MMTKYKYQWVRPYFFSSFKMHGKCQKLGQHRKNILGFYTSQFSDHSITAYNMTHRHIDLQNSPYSQNLVTYWIA